MRVRSVFWPALVAAAGAAWFAVHRAWHDAGTWLLFTALLTATSAARVGDYQAGYRRGVDDSRRGVTSDDPKPWDGDGPGASR